MTMTKSPGFPCSAAPPFTAPGLAFQGIAFEPGAVGQIGDQDFFAGQNVRGFQKIRVNRDAALIVNMCARDRGAVDFAVQYLPLHSDSSFL
jgi:hypothetical protein